MIGEGGEVGGEVVAWFVGGGCCGVVRKVA